MKMSFHSHPHKTHFRMKGGAPGLALKPRPRFEKEAQVNLEMAYSFV